MKVLVQSDSAKLGPAGTVKEVKTGFARNHLLPRGLALEATPAVMRWWDKNKERRVKIMEVRRKEASELASKLAGVSLSFSRRQASGGALFGSVGKSDIVKSLKSCGCAVDKGAVALASAIKTVGEHEVELRLAPDVSAKIKITVAARE